MKASTLKINGSRVVPVDTIRFIKPLTDEDRGKAGANLNIDASKFNVRIEFADKSSKLAADTLDQIRGQGVGLVGIGADRFVPATNIKAADELTEGDLARLRERADYTLKEEFRSRVELPDGGTILSTATAEEIMALRARALGQGGGTMMSNSVASPQSDENDMPPGSSEAPPPRRPARGKGPRPAAE
jgi:hypothetical protein